MLQLLLFYKEQFARPIVMLAIRLQAVSVMLDPVLQGAHFVPRQLQMPVYLVVPVMFWLRPIAAQQQLLFYKELHVIQLAIQHFLL